MLDTVIKPLQGVVKGQAGVAAQTENVLDALQLQHLDEGICP
jgi:hypothetical protein